MMGRYETFERRLARHIARAWRVNVPVFVSHVRPVDWTPARYVVLERRTPHQRRIRVVEADGWGEPPTLADNERIVAYTSLLEWPEGPLLYVLLAPSAPQVSACRLAYQIEKVLRDMPEPHKADAQDA